MKTFARALVIALSVTLFSCGGSTDADKIGDAQLCFDNLGSTTTVDAVNECMAMVDGISSAGAQNIRCSGGFIREGFSNVQKYVDAFRAIEGGTGGTQMQNMMGLLTFTSASTAPLNYSNASTTFNSCLASGGKGSTLLASFAFFAMGLIKYFVVKGGCGTAPPYVFNTCASGVGVMDLSNLAGPTASSTVDPEAIDAQASMGAVIISTYRLSCTGTGANVDLCAKLGTAVTAGAGNPRSVAISFLGSVLY